MFGNCVYNAVLVMMLCCRLVVYSNIWVYLVMLHSSLLGFQQDLDTIDRMIAEGEATYDKWRHPDPYIGEY